MAAFIRLFDEDVTIISLSNFHNRGAYATKQLANLFYPYYEIAAEEEGETGTVEVAPSIKKDTLSVK